MSNNHPSKSKSPFKNYHRIKSESEGSEMAFPKAFKDITPTNIEWLWHNRCTIGMLTLLAGNPGFWKSFAILCLAAELSCTNLFPEEKSHRKVNHERFK
ncbi:hypothetical protein LJC14_04720 [Treponema sp. OttesenSCG-928-L16]|nr:hypothetical protein [Treponema sp. OttesenSCG-928-L16]